MIRWRRNSGDRVPNHRSPLGNIRRTRLSASAAVRVDKSPGELSRVALHNVPLPLGQLDLPQMFPPGPMLREQAGPVREQPFTSVQPRR